MEDDSMAVDKELAPHIEDINRALKGKMSVQEIETELRKWLDMGISIGEAKRGVVKAAGGDPDSVTTPVKLNRLLPNLKYVDILGRIITVNEREIDKKGEKKKIKFGIMGDEFTTRPFTAWDGVDFPYKKGDVLLVKGAYTTDWNGEAQLNFGAQAKFELRDPSEIPRPRQGSDGTASSGSAMGTDVKISELNNHNGRVNINVRLLSVFEKEVEVQGEKKKLFTGKLGDETGAVTFNCWRKDFPWKRFEAVRIENAYIKTWNDAPQINFDESSNVRLLDDNSVPSVQEVALTLADTTPTKIIDIQTGMSGLMVKGRITALSERTIPVGETTKKVLSGTLSDETGHIDFTCWVPAQLSKDQVVTFINAYTRAYRGVPQLALDERTVLRVEDQTGLPSIEELSKATTSTIYQLIKRGGAQRVSITGLIVDIRPSSGLIFRCPQCNRVVQKDACLVHGKVEKVADLRIKAIIDDGTGALNIVAGKDITEKLLGMDVSRCVEVVKEKMDTSVIETMLAEATIARLYTAQGNIVSDDYGIMMIASILEPVKSDIKEEAQNLIDKIRTGWGDEE